VTCGDFNDFRLALQEKFGTPFYFLCFSRDLSTTGHGYLAFFRKTALHDRRLDRRISAGHTVKIGSPKFASFMFLNGKQLENSNRFC
jgi:hypothetical protein